MDKSLALVPTTEIALPPSAGMELAAFIEFTQKHELTQPQTLLLAEMIGVHKQLSVSYVGKLLRNGTKLTYVHAAYMLRDAIPPLYDADKSQGTVKSEFTLPIEKICRLLSQIYRDDEVDEDESVEATIRLLSEVADRCPTMQTWSSVLDLLLDVLDPLLETIGNREGDMLDLPPNEKIEAMIAVIGELNLIEDGRF